MDGYSVHDAATVLGVPEARVWELIARGVLSGAPEADGSMRVFLKVSAPPAARREAEGEPSAGRSETGHANGNGGRAETHPEMSPFRELLTEFRNLTERYGQALLALGEARGEVASLRSRVDLLEARIDMRLPAARPASTAAWEMPDYGMPRRPAASAVAEPEAAVPTLPPTPEPPLPEAADEALEDVSEAVEPEPAADEPLATDAEAGGESRRAALRKERIRTRRQTLGGIAEALARADDPTLNALPGAAETVEALAQLQRESSRQAPDAAIEEPGPEEAEAVSVVPEPVAGEEPMSPDVEELVEPAAAEAVSATVLVEPEDAIELEAEPGPATVEEPAPIESVVEPEPAPEPMTAVEPEPAPEPTAVEPAPAPEPEPILGRAEEASPYSTDVVEPDWFADGDFTWLEVAEQPESAPAHTAAEPQPEIEALEPEPQPREPEPERLDLEPEAPAEPQTGPDARRQDWWPAEAPPEQQSPDVGMDLPRGESSQAGETRASATATTTREEEVMWLGDEFEQADLEFPTPAWRGQASPSAQPEVSVRPSQQPEAPSDDEDDRPAVLELSDEDLARLAEDEGWDVAEVEAIRTFLGRPSPEGEAEGSEAEEAPSQAAAPEPAAPESAASEPAVSREPPGHAAPPAGPPPYSAFGIGAEQVADEPQAGETTAHSDAATADARPQPTDAGPTDARAQRHDAAEPGNELAQGTQPAGFEPRQPRPGDPAWLRGRRGAAATAYRRLRRLFPD